jgi:dihydrofolate reductase
MKVTLRPSISADGLLADKNGECYSWINADDEKRYKDAVDASRCELVGRKTYEQYSDDFALRKNITTFVYTSKTTLIDTENIKFLHGSPYEVIEQIKSYGFTELIMSGGGDLNGSMASAGLIDELQLSIHPIVLGEGIPLFGSNSVKLDLDLIAVNNDIPGIVQHIYRVLN